MRRLALILASLLLSLFMSGSAYAGSMYKWVNESGNVVYSQHPPAEGIKYERIKTINPSRSSPKATAPASSLSAKESILKDQAAREERDLLKKEMDKNAAERAKNCKLARDRLRFFQVQRRWKDKDGNIVSMEDDERLQKLDEAKQQVTDFCS